MEIRIDAAVIAAIRGRVAGVFGKKPESPKDFEALEYLHKEGVVHSDIKPANIMVTHNGGNVRLVDFGLSEIDDSATRRSGIQEDMASVREFARMIGVRPLPRVDESVEGYMRRLARVRRVVRMIPYLGIVVVMAAGVMMIEVMNGRHEAMMREDAGKIQVLEDSAKMLREKVLCMVGAAD